jgi:hypothetical protein
MAGVDAGEVETKFWFGGFFYESPPHDKARVKGNT